MDTDAERRAARKAKLRRRMTQWRFEATELINEIVATAELIEAARRPEEEFFRTNAAWSLVRVLERTRGVPSISDLARAARISRQSAHKLIRRAAHMGYVELLSNPDDKRIVQIRLSPFSVKMLADIRGGEALWVITMLNGLEVREILAASRTVHSIRRRLMREESCRFGSRRASDVHR